MSADTRISKKASSPNKHTKNLDNNCSTEKKLDEDKVKSELNITITEHLCIPCPRLYTDIFNIITIVCKDPSHNQDGYYSEPRSIDSKIAKSTGVKKLSNSFIDKDCNQNTDEAIIHEVKLNDH